MAWIGGVASIFSGIMGSDSAGDAAAAQAGVAERASQLQNEALLRTEARLDPWVQAGYGGNNALLYGLGLGGAPAGGSALTRDQLRNELLAQYTTTTPGTTPQIPVGVNAVAGMQDGRQGYFVENFHGGSEFMPMEGGTSASTTIDEAGLNAAINARLAAQSAGYSDDPNFGALARRFSFGQSDLDNDLVYQNGLQFGLNTGVNQLNQRAASGGMYGSGAALKALTQFGNDYATQRTGDAYNRAFQNDQAYKQNTYNMLSGVSQQGQIAAANLGAAGLNTANAIGANTMAAGNANSAGIIAGANAMSGGLAGATNAYQWNQLLNSGRNTTTPNYGAGINSYLYTNRGSGD